MEGRYNSDPFTNRDIMVTNFCYRGGNPGGSGSAGPGTTGKNPIVKIRVYHGVVTVKEPINVNWFRKLSASQVVAAGITIFLQVISYAIVSRDYRALEISGIGLWGPLVFFSMASFLTLIVTTKNDNKCIMGAAIAFQIISVLVGLLMTFLASLSLARYWWSDDLQIPARLFCSLMLISAMTDTIIALVTSVTLCMADCCSTLTRADLEEGAVFEVEEGFERC